MPGASSPVNVSLGLEILDDVLPGAGHAEPRQVGLDTDDLDVNTVPGDGLQDLVLHPLYVEDEPVDSWVTSRQQESVERQTLEGGARLCGLRNYPSRSGLVPLLES